MSSFHRKIPKNPSGSRAGAAWRNVLPSADHILAQPLKRCCASRIKLNKTFEFEKKETKHTLFTKNTPFLGVWVCRRKNFFTLSSNYAQSPKKSRNLFVLQFCSWSGSFWHDEMRIWLCLYFQHVTRYIGTDFVEEADKKCKDQKRSLFRKGWFDRKVYF